MKVSVYIRKLMRGPCSVNRVVPSLSYIVLINNIPIMNLNITFIYHVFLCPYRSYMRVSVYISKLMRGPCSGNKAVKCRSWRSGNRLISTLPKETRLQETRATTRSEVQVG